MTTAAHSEKSVTHWRKVFAFLLFGVVILAALALASSSRAAVESPPPPQVWSDKADYAPGETVTLSGANWAVGEAVHIRVNDDAGQTWSRDVDVTAADDGTISDQFQLPDSFIAVYQVTATGAQSGTATTSFTDGNIKVKSTGGKDFNYTVRGFTTSSDCTTGGGSTATHLGDTNGTTESSNAGQSLLITANLNANSPNGNAAFQNWSNPDSITIAVGSVNTRTICVSGFASGSKDLIGNYGNTAPVMASDNATRTVNEGQTASNTGTWSDSNPTDTVTLSASVGTVTKSGTNAGGTWSWSFTTNDGPAQSQTVTITANDGTTTATTAFALTVNNVAPTATFNAPTSVNEGSNINLSLTSPSDPSSVDTTTGFTYAFDCGSGYGAFSATSTASCSTNDNGSRTVKGKIKDKDGGETEYTASVTINNVAPTATFPATRTVAEGSPSSFAFTSPSDPSSADTTAGFHYAYSCTGASLAAATYSGSGTAASVSCTYDDGPASPTVRARIIDKDNGFTEYTTAVTVTNVAPTATFNAPSSVNEGSDIHLSLTSPSDPSSADTTAGFEYAFDCGSGYGAFGATNNTDCPTNDNGTRSVKGKIRDKDGGVSEYTGAVTINNVAPTATLANNGPVNEGSAATISFSAQSDPSSADTAAGFHYAYHCDGSAFATDPTYTGTAGSTDSTTCTFDDGPSDHSVRARIIDKDNGFTEYTTSVHVNNVAPTATFNAPSSVNEGSDINLSLTSPSDPSSADTTAGFTYAFDCGSGYGAFGASNSALCSTNDNGTRSVKGKIRDKDNGVTEYTASVTINNVAPTADFTNNGPVNEGTSFTLSMNNGDDVSSVDKAAKFTFAFDCGDGSGYGAFSSTPTLSASTSCSTNDNGTRSVKAKIKDKDGGVSEYTASVTVNNVAPTVTLTGLASANEGDTNSYSYSWTDPGSADTFPALGNSVSCGVHGTASDEVFTPLSKTGSFKCTWSDDSGLGTADVSATVTDDDGGADTDTINVTVANVAPSASFNAPSAVDEGSDISISLSDVLDPGTADTFQYRFKCGDDAWSAYGASSSHACPTSDNGVVTVKGQVRDDDGGESDVYSADVTVNNVAPSVTLTGDATANEGDTKSYSYSWTDPGTADTFPALGNSVSCGVHGTASDEVFTPLSKTGSFKCTWSDDSGAGTADVKAKVTDDDGGTDTDTINVAVANVAPQVNLTGPNTADEGQTKTYNYTITDAGTDDTFSFATGYPSCGLHGDLVGTPAIGDGSFQCNFPDGPNTTDVKIKVQDDDGGISTADTEHVEIIQVAIANVAPTVTAASNQSSDEGELKSFSLGSFSDPGTDSPWAVDVNWGDSSTHTTFDETSTGAASGQTIAAKSHKYDDNGVYTATVKVTDKNGAYDSKTFTVTVANVAPTVTLTGLASANEGDTNSYSYSWTDPGSADTFPALGNSVSCGIHGTASDVVFTPASKTGSFKCTWSDDSGLGTADVSATVTDDDGGADTDTINVTVANVAPSASFNAPSAVDEGSDISISLSDVLDPGTADTFQYRFKCGDDAWSAYGASSSHACPTSDNGVVTVKGQVRDDDGGESDVYSADVTVNNVAPSVTLTGDATANEGDTKSYSYSWTDPGTADTFPALGNSVSCGVHGTASDEVFTPLSKTGSFKCTWSDDSGAGTADVKAKVTDDDGGTDTDTINVAVANVAPQVNLTGPNTADEGQTKTYNYTITDAGTDDTFSFATGYPSCGLHGDLVGTPAIGDGSFQCNFPDGPNTTDVKIKVQDDDGGISTADTEHVEIIQVAIANVAPTVTAASNQSSDEGELKSFSLGSFSDPGTDSPWAVDVNWGDSSTHTTFDETSTGAASGQTIAAKSHKYDDNGVYTATVKVTDKNGAYDSKTFTVTVANVAPTATFSNTGPVNEGTSFTLSLTDPHDPSGADTTAGFTYAFDCGDGSGYGAYGSSTSRSCPTTDNGTRAVKGKIKDKDGGYTAYAASVTVNNVAPTVTGASGQSSDEGENHSFSLGSFSDPGSDSPWAVDVDWGDTSAHTTFNETFAGPAASHAITSKSHKYDDNGTYTVTVKATDKDGDFDSKTFQVTVANVPPTGTPGNNGPINEGGSATASFSAVSDPSVTDSGTLHYAFDCSGGSLAAVTYSTSTATNSKSCSYDDGPSDHAVTGVIIDKDGGRHDDTTSVHVNNVAPSATFNSPASVNEGSSFTLSLTSPSDPSTADAGAGFTYAFDCGSGTYGAFGASNSTSCSTSDNGTLSVRGKIKDKDGGERAYTASVTVNNVAPTATFSNDGPVNEGSSFTIQLTSPSDPSSADTSAGFTYAFDCGSGYGSYGTATSRDCPTTDNGVRAVKGKIKDKDNGEREYTGSVTVNNVAPHITSVTASNSFAGPLVFMTSSISTFFTDPGSADTWINYLTFSDGGAETSTTQPTAQGGNSYKFTLTHSFATPGCKTVTSRVNDDDGGFDTFGPTPVNVGTGEFLPPVTNTPVTNQLKNGQVLPVKVKLTDCNGLSITNLNPAIALKKGDLTSVSDDNIVAITPTSVSNADTTGFMRPSGDGSYIYNMNVNIQLNTDYTLIIYPYGTGSPTQYIAHVIRATK